MSIHSSSSQVEPISQIHEVADVNEVDCCIIGGGPAGAVLSLLLTRQGIGVMLLESHRDFDRDFRGDTLQSCQRYVIIDPIQVPTYRCFCGS